MKKEDHYLEINRQSWNKRTAIHVKSDFYDLDGFLKGRNSLNTIELDLLGDIRGKKILHLQCHFGQDSLSLARLGAEVTAVDLSDASIQFARELAEKTGIDAEFICCDVFELPRHLDKQFDIVFTSYGAIVWLPDLNKWADIISRFLKPDGHFIMAEFHPVLWMFDDDFRNIQNSYFNTKPIIETVTSTYTGKESIFEHEFIYWNHSLSDVLSSLIKNHLEINIFQEFDHSPYNCFIQGIEPEPGKYRIKDLDNNLPMVFALKATKKSTT